MAVPFRLKFDDKKLQAQLAQMVRDGDPLPFLKQIGTWMAYKSPELNWRTGGKRYHPGGWKKLSPMTLAIRKWNATSPKGSGQAYTDKILEVSGNLRGKGWSFRVRGSGDTANMEAGTNNPHADTHQFGKWISAMPSWERPMAKVPQRILIAVAPDDMRMAGVFADRHMKKTVPGAH